MFKRSSRGLTKKYQEEYQSYKVSGVKSPLSFNQYIVKKYNAQLRILQKEFKNIPNSMLSKEELKIKKRVLNSAKMFSAKDVSKNISRAVKRLDILRNIAKSGRGYVDDKLPSDLSTIAMKKNFMESDKVSKSMKNMLKSSSSEDTKILFDFLNNMKKNAGGHLDAYYKLEMEQFYDKLQQAKQKGQYIKPDDISGERLNIMLSMFKIENSSKYNMDKKQLSDTIHKVWNDYYSDLSDDEERAIKKIAKRKLGLDLQ